MKKKLTILLAVLLLVSLLSGCGSSAGTSTAPGASADTAPMAPAEAPSDFNSGASSGSWGMDNKAEYDYPADDSYAPAPMPEPEGNSGPSSDGNLQPIAGSVPENVKLIYTADISLQTTEFDDATKKLNELVSSLGGYYESSSVNNYSSYRSGSYTVRVPAKSFDSFCSQVGQLCQLNYISRSARDVSETYYDLESRLATQQTKLERLQELLSRAETMEDIITIESAISETELEIEWLTGDLRHYDSLVGYSTINISLDEVYRLEEVEQPVIGFGAKLAAALKNGGAGFIWAMQGLLLGFANHWVGWLIFLGIAAVAVAVMRRRRRRKSSGWDKKDEN